MPRAEIPEAAVEAAAKSRHEGECDEFGAMAGRWESRPEEYKERCRTRARLTFQGGLPALHQHWLEQLNHPGVPESAVRYMPVSTLESIAQELEERAEAEQEVRDKCLPADEPGHRDVIGAAIHSVARDAHRSAAQLVRAKIEEGDGDDA